MVGNTHAIQLPNEAVASNIISTWQDETILCKWFIIINFCWH